MVTSVTTWVRRLGDRDAPGPGPPGEGSACLNQPLWQEDYQLSGALVGLGVYALERLRVGWSAFVPPLGDRMPPPKGGTSPRS